MPTINLKRNTVKPVKWHTSTSAPYYNSSGWKHLRNAYLSCHPLCERCMLRGISKQAEEVHHKKPFLSGQTEDERWQLLLQVSNLMSLCRKCHHEIHHSDKKPDNTPRAQAL